MKCGPVGGACSVFFPFLLFFFKDSSMVASVSFTLFPLVLVLVLVLVLGVYDLYLNCYTCDSDGVNGDDIDDGVGHHLVIYIGKILLSNYI